MTMFTRNDKPADATGPSATPQTPPPAPVEVKRPQATAQLESTEDIRIDGEVDGDVRAASVTVGSNARVKGTVYGDTVELAGTVDGKIEAKKVVLMSTARMTGDVVHQDIKIESGAFIDGHLKPEFGKQETRPKPVAAVREAPKPTEVRA